MADYQADPGGVFESDTHRRVLGHLPPPGEEPLAAHSDEALDVRTLRRTSLFHRLLPDQDTDLDADELGEVLSDLEADGLAAQTDAGWAMTDAGLAALQAPVAEEARDG